MSWPIVVWLISSLATARATRLVVDDEFPFGGLRAWAEENTRWLGALLTCPWCASGWLSGATLLVVWSRYPTTLPAVCWFGLWMAALIAYHFTEMLAKFSVPD